MRLIGTCMASNEADIIEAFVRHNLGLLDVLVVLDHASLDATPDILVALVKEGLKLVVLQDQDPAFKQGERQTFLARRYLDEVQADFCFALDADEFIRCDSRAALEASLARLPAGACGLVSLQNYFGAGTSEVADPPRRLTRRMRAERKPMRKVVLPRAFAGDPACHVALGNHSAVRVADGRVAPLPHALVDGATLAHFPVRSPEQVAKKALLGWLSHRLTRPERYSGDQSGANVPAAHWRDLFDRIANGGQPLDARLVQDAIQAYAGGEAVRDDELVEDPLPVRYALSHREAGKPNPLASLASWTKRLLDRSNQPGRS